jgi:hypothetical protein
LGTAKEEEEEEGEQKVVCGNNNPPHTFTYAYIHHKWGVVVQRRRVRVMDFQRSLGKGLMCNDSSFQR